MSRPLRLVSTDDLVRIGRIIRTLKDARSDCRRLGARQTLKKINSAIKSAEGAERHAHHAYQRREK